MRDPDKWRAETYSYAEGAVPVLIDPAQWDRVQAKLKAAAERYKQRGSARRVRRTDELAHAPLLEDLIFCEHCHGKMTRYYNRAKGLPYYNCNKTASIPNHPCKPHHIRADKADDMAMRLLAATLADPEQLLQLADAVEADVATESALARAELAAHEKHLRELDDKRRQLEIALKALSAIPDADTSPAVQNIRANLAQVDADQKDVLSARDSAKPRTTRASPRRALLDKLTTHRRWLLNFADDDTLAVTPLSDELRLRPYLAPDTVADLLGVSISDLKLPTHIGYIDHDPEHPGTDVEVIEDHDVDTAEVIYLLLRHAPRARIRRLMRDLGVVITVRRPWSREVFRERGATPIYERVKLVAQAAVAGAAALQVGINGTNACAMTSLPSSNIVASSVLKLSGGRK